MKKINKTIAYLAFLVTVFVVMVFTMPITTNAWASYSDDPYYYGSSDWGYGDYGYNDYCYDCYSGGNYDYGYNDYCYDCYSWGNYDYYDLPTYTTPSSTYNDNWAYSTSYNETIVDNYIDIDLSRYLANNHVTQVSNLSVSCYASDSIIEEGDTVLWTANAYGGNGNYNYSWSGSENLQGSFMTVAKSYNNEGAKTATVTVISGTRTITQNCGTVIVDDDNDNDNDDDFDVTCRARPSRVDEGERVTWEAEVRGVDEDDVDFRWSGDADGDGEEVTERYNRSGTYEARVRATYRGQTETDECTVRVEDEDNGNGNVTLSSTPTGNLASLNSVYLSQVPYTGVADNMKFAGIATLLGLISAWIAYEVVRVKARKDHKNHIADFKAHNLASKI